MTALVLKNVTKRFGGLVATNDVSLRVPQAAITGVIGPNGAGKTTIVNLVTGMLPLTSGQIFLDERELTHEAAHDVGRAGIARTFQNIRLLREASVVDNIMVGFHRHETASIFTSLFGLPAARRETVAMRARTQTLLERFSMARYADHPAGSLAYGHQRRVEMMRALAAEPRILILDEPVAGMNDVEAHELGDIFNDLARSGVGIMLIEHNMRFVMRLCAHIYVLDGGKLIAEGNPDAIVNDPAVITAYLGT